MEESSSFNDSYGSSRVIELITNESFNQTNQKRDGLYIVIPITVIYVAIFITGLVGNVSTCVVIAKNRSMHTATNYYLFSLAVSDLLLLLSGLPPEMYYIWSHYPYVFGEVFCIIQSFAAETSANATVLTITAFTVERYVAICHPFLSHTMSKLSRAVKYVILIWLMALGLAIPQAIQFGIAYAETANGTVIPGTGTCSVKWVIVEHAFEISTILFFVLPMTIITVLYILIGIKLRNSRILVAVKRNPTSRGLNCPDSGRSRGSSQRNVIRMLVAVVAAFFICWAPFHAQRLLAVYAKSMGDDSDPALVTVYTALTYISGIFYYLSTTVNPLLYNIMSHKFREAFKTMLAEHCGRRRSNLVTSPRRQVYSSVLPYQRTVSKRLNHNSGLYSVSDETQRLTPVTRNYGIQEQSYGDPCIAEESVTQSNNSPGAGSISVVTSLKANNQNEGCTENVGLSHSTITKCLKVQRPLKSVTLGLWTGRLRCTTKGLFAHQHKQRKQRIKFDTIQCKIQNNPSIESANTISNSSLHDSDETEFTESELAKYMGEINFDLVT